jgi:Plasmid pRiA4b ORF-3-like protein
MSDHRPHNPTVYQLKVSLRGSKPLIWRRLQVASDISLNRLHLILQLVMGWGRKYPYQFDDGITWYGQDFVDEDGEYTPVGEDDLQAPLAEVAPRVKASFEYHYQLDEILLEGTWNLKIQVEQILPATPELRVPFCLDGKRAGPPEDFPGIGGYEGCVLSLRDPADPRHNEARNLLGEGFDPDAFDVDEINRRLAAVASLEAQPESWQRKPVVSAGRPPIGSRWIYGSRSRR